MCRCYFTLDLSYDLQLVFVTSVSRTVMCGIELMKTIYVNYIGFLQLKDLL